MSITKILSARRWYSAVGSAAHEARVVGLRSAAKLSFCHAATFAWRGSGVRCGPGRVTLRVPFLQHPLFVRPFSSDVYVARQVLVEQEHAVLRGLSDVKFIVDCGANIGCSAAFLLSLFPSAELVAIEPDPQNFELLRENLRPYGSRAVARHAAVWGSSAAALEVNRGSYRDGLDWSTTVGDAADGRGDVEGVTLTQVMADAGLDAIDLLKIDIEGSERQLLAAGKNDWLSRTKHLCIELHGPECETALDLALVPYSFDRVTSNELQVVTNLRRRGAAASIPQ